jgi:tRNA A37 threonylcarbamoyladenosine synthetase subunit TsaC/SUA5/YrdC
MSLKNETIYEIKERPLEKKVGCFIDHPQDIPNLPEELLPLLYKC